MFDEMPHTDQGNEKGKGDNIISLVMIEDSPEHQDMIKNVLSDSPMDISITIVDTAEKGLELIVKQHIDIILLNYSLPQMNGLEFLAAMREKGYYIPTIMITGHGNEEIAVQAMKMGIYDYVNKCGEYLPKLNLIIKRALEEHELKIKQEELRVRTKYINSRLQQEKKKLENIISAIGAGLAIIDRDYRLVWLNRTMEEWFKSEKNIEGIYCYKLFRQGSQPCSKCMMLKTFELGIIQRSKHYVIDHSGERKHYQLTTTPLVDINGNITQVLCLIQDITQQVGMQLKLIQAGKLAAIGELSSGLAHQLNNPLVGILNFVQLLQKKIPPADPARELLDTVERGAIQCKDIVRNLLNFSSPHHFNYEILDMHTVLESAFVLIENNLRSSNIEIIKDIPNQLPPVEGNITQIQQVFLNLMMNSLHAMPKGGKIIISTHHSHDENHQRDYCVVKFTDTGPGIPKSIRDKIFDPFFTTKEKDKGTGLGLSIASAIVKAHNGKIELESQEGEGTTFAVSFLVAQHTDNY